MNPIFTSFFSSEKNNRDNRYYRELQCDGLDSIVKDPYAVGQGRLQCPCTINSVFKIRYRGQSVQKTSFKSLGQPNYCFQGEKCLIDFEIYRNKWMFVVSQCPTDWLKIILSTGNQIWGSSDTIAVTQVSWL